MVMLWIDDFFFEVFPPFLQGSVLPVRWVAVFVHVVPPLGLTGAPDHVDEVGPNENTEYQPERDPPLMYALLKLNN